MFLKIYRWATRRISPGLKSKIRGAVELSLDIGRKNFYGQFGEDAVVQSYFETKMWQQDNGQKVFGSKTKLPKGFYIDIGAYSPKQFSNSYWFYRQGWNGMNIDATPGSMKNFKLIRPRDINIEAVISNEIRPATFYSWSIPCVVNTLSEEHARKWAAEMGREPMETQLMTERLEEILDKHLPVSTKISFMSVDVEGHGLEVLQSNNWLKYRPELIIIEDDDVNILADIPNSPLYRFLKDNGYELYSWVRPNLIFKDSIE
jgi:hypothetical protein